MTDNVNNPSHYKRFRFECEPKDFTKHLPHPLASAIEYFIRSPYKANELEDLQKASVWLEELVDTDSFWEGTSVDGRLEFYSRIRIGAPEERTRYLASAWGLASTCPEANISDLFYREDPMRISRHGVISMLEEIQHTANSVQLKNSIAKQKIDGEKK